MISVIQRRTSVYTENIASSTGSDPKYQISLILALTLLLLYHHTVIIASLLGTVMGIRLIHALDKGIKFTLNYEKKGWMQMKRT